jgi:hypothetical protein
MSAAIVESRDTPPKGRLKRMLWVAGLFVALFILSEFTDGYFIPDPATMLWSFILAAASALLVLLFFAHVMYVVRKKPDATLGVMALLLLITLCFVVFILFSGTFGLSYGVANIYTELVGRPATRQVTVIRWLPRQHHRRSTDTCAGVDIPKFHPMIEHLCLARQVAPGTVLTLHGQQSILGFHVGGID